MNKEERRLFDKWLKTYDESINNDVKAIKFINRLKNDIRLLAINKKKLIKNTRTENEDLKDKSIKI